MNRAVPLEPSGSPPRTMRTFIIIWLGELVSIAGSGMTSFALGVWIYQKTGQATPFALTVLFATLPRLLLMPLAGMLADRWNRRLLMILGDAGSALATLAVAVLAVTGRLDLGWIYLLVALSSAFTTFQEPAYRASVVMLVPKKDLARASGMMNGSEALQMLLSPLLAGALFGVIGLGGIILIDFITCLFAIGALLVVRIPQPRISAEELASASAPIFQKPSLARDMRFAWRYLRARPGLFGLLWYFALVNFLLNISVVLLGPLVLSFSTPVALGAVQMGLGLGMLAGSVLVSAWGGPKRQTAGIVGFIALAGVGLAIAGLRPSVGLIGLGMVLMLFSIPISQACSTAITQAKTEPSVQGRLFAVRSLISQSMTPLAFLLAGPLADQVFNPLMEPGGALGSGLLGQVLGAGPGRGIGVIFLTAGLVLVLASLLAWSNPRIRNLAEELPDVLAPAEPAATGAPEMQAEPLG